PNWQAWDTGLKSANLNGPFQLGTKGKLKPDKGPSAKFKIVAFEQGQSYTFKTNLPFGGLYVKRFLQKTPRGIQFTHEVWFTGLTKKLFARKFGPRYQEMLPKVMQSLKTIAEQ
ncbi:MAG: polyketide cyclase, partial [Bacteroidota bacterium]